MIGYPELVLLQIKFAENYGNIDEALVDTVQYMKRNLKAKNDSSKPYNILLH